MVGVNGGCPEVTLLVIAGNVRHHGVTFRYT